MFLYSKDPEADRKFFRDTLEFPHVDAGHGWLIFALPPSEVAVHPAEENGRHELYLMCEDVKVFVAAMKKHNVGCGPVVNRGWGLLTRVMLPGGGKLGVYEPRHARPSSLRKKKSLPARARQRPGRSARKGRPRGR